MTSYLRFVAFFVMAALTGCADMPSTTHDQARLALAPDGKLRMGIYDAPLFMTLNPVTGTPTGIAPALGRILAADLGVEFEAVVFPRTAADSVVRMLDCGRSGECGLLYLAHSVANEDSLSFPAWLVTIDSSVMVPGPSRLRKVSDLGGSGARIAVVKGSAADDFLTKSIPGIEVQRHALPADRYESVARGAAEGVADSVHPLSLNLHRVTGGRLLEGSFMASRYTFGHAKGRHAADRYLADFAARIKADGRLAQAIRDAGLVARVDP